MTNLRLFPLHTVLFPGMTLPLQVFEERYRLLITECLAQQTPFGVVLIREGVEVGGGATPYDTGTTARIEQVEPAGDGRLSVQTKGERRFRILQLHHDQPYLSAEVEYPVDEVTEAPASLVDEVAQGYIQLQRLRQTIEGGYQREIRPPETAGVLADALGTAAHGVLPPPEIQPLLETLDHRRRLERAAELLTRLLEATHHRAQVTVAQRWGGVERRN